MKQRQQTPIELSLFMMRSYIFVTKYAQTTLLCSVVMLVCLLAISAGHLGEGHLNNFVSSLTREVIS